MSIRKPDFLDSSMNLNISSGLSIPGVPFQNDEVMLVRILWVDTCGQHRCRVVPQNIFSSIVGKNGVGLTCACMALISAFDSVADGTNLSGVGEIRLVPDLSTHRRIPWEKREAMVLGDMCLRTGEAWDYCPRHALSRVSKILKDEFDLEMNAGFENEFYILKKIYKDGKEEWEPFDFTNYCSTTAHDAASSMIIDISATLSTLGIPLEQLHAESGNGQFEIILGHKVCANAADDLIYTREVIKAIVRRNGNLATFVPKPFLEDIGSGCHVHVSLFKDGENVFMASDNSSRHGISKMGEEFMAGVLSHLSSIFAFVAPLPNSYNRIKPNTWSGAYKCWGKDNKEAPIRTACPPGIPDGLVSNFEIKSFDGCANPYLGLASIMAAGIDGLRRHLAIPDPIEQNPCDIHTKLEKLPSSLSESVHALEKDMEMKTLVGDKLCTAVIGVRKAEVDYYEKNKDAEKLLIYKY